MNTARTIRRGITVVAIAALCVVVAVPAYAAYEDSLKGYWNMDDLGMDDNFNSGSLSTARWSVSSGTSWNNNAVRTVAPAGNNYNMYGVFNTQSLRGDFDVQVNFSMVNWPSTSDSWGEWAGLRFGDSVSGHAVEIYRKKNNSSDYYEGGAYTGSWSLSSGGPTQGSGTMRITRSGSTVNTYYNNGGWQLLKSVSGFTANDLNSVAVFSGPGTSGNSVTVDYDNFIVTSGETAADAKGVNKGTIYGATQTTGKTGYNTALNFDGVDDSVNIGAISGYSANTLTVSGWVNLETANRYNTIWSNYLDNSNRIYMSVSSANNLYVYGVEEGTMAVAVTDPSTFQTGVWTHVAATFDSNANVSTLYVNGAQVATQGYSAVTVNNNIIGRYAGVSEGFDGSMDDFAIWSRTLDSNEISMLYDLGTEKFEWLTLGVNDADALNLGYTTSELKLLADLYAEQETGSSETIDGVTWHYLSGDLPGDIGGTTYDYGDTWTYDGRSYIKLGSGLEGSPIPEPGCAFGLLVGFFVPGLRKVLKRKVRS